MQRGWLVLVFLIAALRGQNISCALSGEVQDSLGAPFPGIEVTIADVQNGFLRSIKTNTRGFFAFPDLTPGTFTLSIAASGFALYHEHSVAGSRFPGCDRLASWCRRY